MLNNTLPKDSTPVVREPIVTDWTPIIIGSFIIIFILAALFIFFKMKKRFEEEHHEWIESQKFLDSHKNVDYFDYISMTFKQFHEYYSLNPDRYQLEYATVRVKNLDFNYEDVGNRNWKEEYTHMIVFNWKDYKKYRAWVKRVTNGMEDPQSVGHMLRYLDYVQADIDAIRAKEAEALEASQKAMENFNEQLKSKFMPEVSPEEQAILDISKQ